MRKSFRKVPIVILCLVFACGGGDSPSSTTGSSPSPPTGLSAVAGPGQVILSWNAVTGATSYNIYRSTSSGVTGSAIAMVTATSYKDSTVTNGTTYYYEVTAANSYGESAVTNQVQAIPIPGTPGQDWTQQTSGTTESLLGVTWSGTQFVAVGSSGVTV